VRLPQVTAAYGMAAFLLFSLFAFTALRSFPLASKNKKHCFATFGPSNFVLLRWKLQGLWPFA
jgi:hypothetical protein